MLDTRVAQSFVDYLTDIVAVSIPIVPYVDGGTYNTPCVVIQCSDPVDQYQGEGVFSATISVAIHVNVEDEDDIAGYEEQLNSAMVVGGSFPGLNVFALDYGSETQDTVDQTIIATTTHTAGFVVTTGDDTFTLVDEIAARTAADAALDARIDAIEGNESEATWGEITGALADQTDLTAVLTTKVSYDELELIETRLAVVEDLTAEAGPINSRILDLEDAGTNTYGPHVADTNNPHGVTKSQVGLGSVDNTSDSAKPVSTATQTALDARLAKSSNLSDLTNAATARTNLGLGSLATQNGTFSGTSSGTNTGDRTIRSIDMLDDFMGTSGTGGSIGDLGWSAVGIMTIRGSEAGHPGIYRMQAAGSATAAMYPTYLAGQGMSVYDGQSIAAVIRLESLTNVRVTFGLGLVNAVTNGRKCWFFDPAVSANWQLLHETSGGTRTYTDSGIAATTGWQVLELSFSGGTTTGTVTTAGGTYTGTNSGSATEGSTGHVPQFICVATTATTKYIEIDAYSHRGTSTRL